MIRSFVAMPFVLAAGVAFADVPRVVTDIAPVHSLVARVMDGVGVPDVILPAGASPHDHAMRPSEARLLSDADIVIWVGPELTQWLKAPIDTLAPNAVRLGLSDLEGVVALPIREGGAFGEHDSEDEAAHDDHGAEGAVDPHLWLDPQNGLVWIEAIAGALSALDPDNAAAYAANAQSAAEEISAEADRIAALMGAAPQAYLAFHDAFQYAETWLGITGVGAIQSGHAVELGPAQLAELREQVLLQGVTCVLAEPQFNSGLVEAVMGEGAGRIVTIDPLGGEFEVGPSLYLAVLDQFSEIPKLCD